MMFPLQEQMVGDLRPAVVTLVGAVGLVLLVACVNVANLLLARSAARAREVSMRTALGARRGRLVRQMLTESLVLAGAGGIAGLGVAALCHRGLLALVGDRIPVPRLEQVALDLPVVIFTMAIALTTGLLFGLVPAFVSTSEPADTPARRWATRWWPPVAPRAARAGRRGSGPVARAPHRCGPAGAQLHQAAERRSRLPRRERPHRRRAAAGEPLRYQSSRGAPPRVAGAHRGAARGPGRRGLRLPAGPVCVHRHELLARRSAQAARRSAVIRVRSGRSRLVSSRRWGSRR